MIRAWRHPGLDAAIDPSSPRSLPLPLVSCDLAEPDPAGDQVLVRVEASVIGEPELHHVTCTPGGAAVGTVARTGQDATHLLGKRVLVGPEQACGECDVCRRAHAVVCPHGAHLGRTADGTLATAVVARARWLCVLEGELSGVPGLDGSAAALLAREAAWAYAMFARAGVAPGEPVVIVGGNVVARFLAQIAVAKGVRPMVLVHAEDQAFAQWVETHGGVALRPDTAEAHAAQSAARVAAEHGGFGKRPWYVFETSARTEARHVALGLAGPGVRLTLLGRGACGHREPGPLLPVDSVMDADGMILGVAGAHPDLLPEVAALVVRGELDVAQAADVTPMDELTPERVRQARHGSPPQGLVVTMPRATDAAG